MELLPERPIEGEGSLNPDKDNNSIGNESRETEKLGGKLANVISGTDPNTNNNSISAANLLKGVEKSYEKEKLLLDDHTKGLDENGESMVEYHGWRVDKQIYSQRPVCGIYGRRDGGDGCGASGATGTGVR